MDDLLLHGQMIFDELFKYSESKILVEETELRFPQSMLLYPDAIGHFEKLYAVEIPNYKIAAVIDKKFEKIGDFMQVLCSNAGFRYAAFSNFEKAEQWLLND